MNFQTQLFELIKTNNAQVPNLRSRAINGNKQTLQAFCSVILKLLTVPNTHQAAYREINQFLISANPSIAQQIDMKIMETVAKNHCQQKLEQYIIFWKRIMSGSVFKSLYPNLNNKLKSIHLRNQYKSLSPKFLNYNQVFEKNLSQYNSNKIEFFEYSDNSFSESSISEESGSDIAQMNLLQMKKIRNILQKDDVDEKLKSEYLLKAINFISSNPKNIKYQMKDQYEQYLAWAKKLVYSSGKAKSYNMTKTKLKKQETQKQKQIDKNKQLQAQKQKNKQVQKQSKDKINIVNSQEQIVVFKQQAPKRTKSKRFNLDSSKKDQIFQDKIDQNNKGKKDSKDQIKKDLIQDSKKLITTQTKLPEASSHYNVRITSPQIEVKFIQDTDQLQEFMNSQKSTPNQNKQSKDMKININVNPPNNQSNLQSPKQQELIIKKYGDKKQQLDLATPYKLIHRVNIFQTPISKNLQINEYQKHKNSHSSSTAFNYKGQGSTYKKLSQFSKEKKQRKRYIENQPLGKIQDYVILPYLQNFDNLSNFNQYRSNCLQDYSLLYASPLLYVNCSIVRLSSTKAKVQMLYQNKCDVELIVQTVYKVPKCMRVNKQSTIKKKWTLKQSNSHSFCLQIISFPLEVCLINLKYAYKCNHDDLRQYQPTVISLPITMRNFLEFLIMNEYQWIQKWMRLTQNKNYKAVKNIVLQQQVVNQENLQSILKQFTKLNPIEGYSIKQLGLYCRQLQMTFLLRISQRIGHILTIEILSDKKDISKDQIDYLQYCLNTWGMLLARVQYEVQA